MGHGFGRAERAEDSKHFPYTFSLAALDSSPIGMMMKEGAAQYNGQRFLISEDSGKSWKIVVIPNTTLYNFLREVTNIGRSGLK